MDPVAEGLREWERVKQVAADAALAASVAKDEAARLRGENDVLRRQHAEATTEARRLRAVLDEAKVHCRAAGGMFVDVLKKLDASVFREPGSREVKFEPRGREGFEPRGREGFEPRGKIDGVASVEGAVRDLVAATEQPDMRPGTLHEGDVADLGARHGADNPRPFTLYERRPALPLDPPAGTGK